MCQPRGRRSCDTLSAASAQGCFTLQRSPARAENLRGQIARGHRCFCFLGKRRHFAGQRLVQRIPGVGSPSAPNQDNLGQLQGQGLASFMCERG